MNIKDLIEAVKFQVSVKPQDEFMAEVAEGLETLYEKNNIQQKTIEKLQELLNGWKEEAYKLSDNYDKAKNEAVKEFAENVTYCKECKNYELIASNNQYFCNKYGGYVMETDCCSRGTRLVKEMVGEKE